MPRGMRLTKTSVQVLQAVKDAEATMRIHQGGDEHDFAWGFQAACKWMLGEYPYPFETFMIGGNSA